MGSSLTKTMGVIKYEDNDEYEDEKDEARDEGEDRGRGVGE